MDDEFYIQFEDKFRGNRQLIKDRLRVYIPIINPLKDLISGPFALDLGCGRGEWLELLQENGWQGVGIDTNQKIVDFCKKLGLNAIHEDTITYLHSVKSETISAVTGFHIAEHLSFKLLQELVREAHRVLLPGGFLILETPNPENIIVGTSSFYLDPTHVHPLPAQLLSFLTEYYGFNRTKILRLQETPQISSDENTDLLGVLSGVSQDYAIVAQKNAEPEILAVFDNVFGNEYGITLESLAQRYDSQKDATTQQHSSELEDIQTDLSVLRSDLDTLGPEHDRLLAELIAARIDLQELRMDLEHVRADRNRIQVDLDVARIDIQSLLSAQKNTQTEKENVLNDLNIARNELQSLRVDLENMLTERDGLQKKVEEIRVERDDQQIRLDEIRDELDRVQTRLYEIQTEREVIRSQFNEAQSKFEAVQSELNHVYSSRSYRITAPLRAVFGYSRVQRERLLQLRSGLAFKERLRNLASRIVSFSRHIPFFAVVIEKFKHRFPRFWRRISINVKKMINPTQQFVNIIPDNSIEELHYLNLFRHEITKRRKG